MDRTRASSDRNRPPQVLDVDQLTTPGLTPGTGMRRIEPAPAAGSAAATTSHRVGYGLPCAQCGTYYTADLTACPVCQSNERVSANAPQAMGTAEILEQPVRALPATA